MPDVQGFRGSEVQELMRRRSSGVQGLRVSGFQGLRGSEVQRLMRLRSSGAQGFRAESLQVEGFEEYGLCSFLFCVS